MGEEDEECVGMRCIWYDPWESDCRADFEVWSNCKLGNRIS